MSASSGIDVVVRGWTGRHQHGRGRGGNSDPSDKIVAIGPDSLLPKATGVIDASGKLVLPVSSTVICTSAPKYDDWRTAPLAAARTGLTTCYLRDLRRGETLRRRLRACARRPSRSPCSTSVFISS